jgi:hypothetical protein
VRDLAAARLSTHVMFKRLFRLRVRQSNPLTPSDSLWWKRSGLHICVACGGDYVYAHDRREKGDGRWSLSLRCGACQHRREVAMTRRMVMRFDADVDRGRSAIARALACLDLERMTEQADAFARALERDLIDADDFGD